MDALIEANAKTEVCDLSGKLPQYTRCLLTASRKVVAIARVRLWMARVLSSRNK